MSTPDPIGAVYYDEPRAVQIREPKDVKNIHSAVHSAINVITETQLETNMILGAWPEIMQAAADKANELLTELRAPGNV